MSRKVVDLFAGAGGWTEGVRQAGGRVLMAVNHWKTAVRSHGLNHPETEHVCQDLGLMSPHDLPDMDDLVTSPSCQGHSNARGKEQPRHDKARATAWCVVSAAEAKRPPRLYVENVIEFRDWGLYPLWRQALETLGYDLSESVLDASEFGVPQERKRLFIVGALGCKAPRIRSPKLRPISAGEFININSGQWSEVNKPGRSKKTLRQIKRARGELGRTFLIPYYGSGSGLTGRSLDRPIGTITTRDRYAIVDGDRMRMLTIDEYKAAMAFPPGYQLEGTRADQIMQLGNAVSPKVAREVFEQAA